MEGPGTNRNLRSGGIGDRCPYVAEDRRVNAVRKWCTCIATGENDIRKRANPVIGCLLVGLEDEGVALACKDLNGIDAKRLNVLAVHFDDYLGEKT